MNGSGNTWKEDLKQARECFKDHRLTVVNDHPEARVWKLAKPGTGIMSVYIADLPTGVFLSGDTCYGSHHELFARYKRIDWFRSIASEAARSWSYLALKFGMARRYDAEAAKAEILDWVEQAQEEAKPDSDGEYDHEALRFLAKLEEVKLDTLDFSNEWEVTIRMMQEFGWEEPPGHRYDSMGVATLVAVTEAFVREESKQC